jgi:hypothetical protein
MEVIMSAFLGPIHFWLYNKIKLQENFIQNILDASSENNWYQNLENEVNDKFGKTDDRPLEEIIDQSNIHGWLQGRIAIAEKKLAFAVTNIIGQNSDYISELKKVAFNFGATNSITENSNAADCYKYLTDSLIDGMPCDRVNEVIESDAEQVIWSQNICVHSDYWTEVGGNIDVYYSLRHEIIKGMLSKSELEYISNENRINIIRRK